jgi:hypothetical protein
MPKKSLAVRSTHLTELAREVDEKRRAFVEALAKAPDTATMVAQINLAGIFPDDEATAATQDVARGLEKLHVNDRVRLYVDVKRLEYEEALTRLRSAEDEERQNRAEAIQVSVKSSYWAIVWLTVVIAVATLVQTCKALGWLK